MRGIWGILSKICAIGLVFGGTVNAVDNFRCHDSFFTVVVDSTLDARTNEYIQPIKTSKEKLKIKNISTSDLRDLSEMWIGLAKRGKIAQVYPGYYGESLIDGPKGDIFRTCSEIAIKLSDRADEEASVNDPDAYLDAIRSIEVINLVRYGSYETLFTTTSYLRKPTRLLKANLNKLNPTLLARLLKAQNPDERSYKTNLLEQVSARQRGQYALRYGAEMAKEDDSTYNTFIGLRGQNVAAERFFGFDREIGYKGTKANK